MSAVRRHETIDDKARRYLAEGWLHIERVDGPVGRARPSDPNRYEWV